jgi:hypothetical protein
MHFRYNLFTIFIIITPIVSTLQTIINPTDFAQCNNVALCEQKLTSHRLGTLPASFLGVYAADTTGIDPQF